MVGDKGGQIGATDFFFAFQQKGHVARQIADYFEPRFEPQELGEMLAFVVTGAPPIDAAGADSGGKGGRNPGFEGVGWLHVVVTIEEHRRLAGVFVVASHHHRPARRGV